MKTSSVNSTVPPNMMKASSDADSGSDLSLSGASQSNFL
jgi:hypothetical protein